MKCLDITQDRLRELFRYDVDSGIFTRKVTVNNFGAKDGDVAGCPSGHGYLQIRIDKQIYFAHRLAWLYMTGNLPKQVDHKNGCGSDNRWTNLREASQSQNMCNTRQHTDNHSGFKGVTYNPTRNKWQAQITFEKRRLSLGRFSTATDAAKAYDNAAQKIHGEFAVLNFPSTVSTTCS